MAGIGAHRDDIDGLRSIAILPVLFYHANIWPFTAGYVGVDVFFVISGYLITGLILRAQCGAGFSLVDFYDRRVRRILPALGVVLLAATIAALVLLMPYELEAFAKSLAVAIAFIANVRAWIAQTDYFGYDTRQNPLLHLWSLSVEEQFYLIWPLLLIALRTRPHIVPTVVAILAALSLLVAFAFADTDPSFTFYLLPARGWQLLIGAFLAAAPLSPIRLAAARTALAASGAALVAVGIFAPFHAPLYHSIAAAFGAAAILVAGNGSGNVVSRALASRLPVFIGLISYSLYLWHWPMLVFARLALNHALSVAQSLCIMAISFALAVLTWRYVEQPARRRAATPRSEFVSFGAAAGGSFAFLAIAAAMLLSHGLPSRIDPTVRPLLDEATAALDGRWCSARDNCIYGNPSWRDEIVLWGDSHARVLAAGLVQLAAQRHSRLRVLTHRACRPLLGLPTVDNDKGCAQFDRDAEKLILSLPHIDLVVIEARWELEGREFRNGTPREALATMDIALDRLIATLTGRGLNVLIVGNVPLFPAPPADCIGRDHIFGRDPKHCGLLSVAASDAVIGPTDRLAARVAARHARSRVFFPRTALCDRTGCHAFAAGRLLYADPNHLTPLGARRVTDAMEVALRHWPD